jgi:hypothetical protein
MPITWRNASGPNRTFQVQDRMNRQHRSRRPSVSSNEPDALLRLRSCLRPTNVPRTIPALALAQAHRVREKPEDCPVEGNHPSEGSDAPQFADIAEGNASFRKFEVSITRYRLRPTSGCRPNIRWHPTGRRLSSIPADKCSILGSKKRTIGTESLSTILLESDGG